MILYFSGTGNTEWVAKTLARETGQRCISLSAHMLYPEENPVTLEKDEPLGLCFPVYGWAPPAIVLDFLSHTTIPIPPYIFAVCTMGDDAGKSQQVLQQAMADIRWPLDAMFGVTMPNTYTCLPGFDVDKQALRDSKLGAMSPRIKQIAEQVNQRVNQTFDVHEGALPWTKTHVLGAFFRRFLMDSEPFHTTDACTECGLCVRSCPVENIQMAEGRPQWRNHCEMCLSCYHHCPANAVQYGRQTKGKGQYLISKYIRKDA